MSEPGARPPDAERTLRGAAVCIAGHPNVAFLQRRIAARLEQLGGRVVVLHPPYDAPPASTQVLITCSAFKCDGAMMDSLPRLRGIAAIASGTENIDVGAATERSIVVAHSPTPVNVTSMAEATVMLILAGLYRLDRSIAEMRDGWRTSEEPFARTLSGKTLGLIGFGKIAAAVAQRLAAWDVRILTTTRRAEPDNLPAHVRRTSLEELLAESDVVSLHGRADAELHGMVGPDFLSRLKPGAVLVNTARGALVDEQALVRGVEAGSPSFVALDCFQHEPLSLDSPLRHQPDAMLTPHMVGHTREVQESLIEQGVQNTLDIVNLRPPEFVRNVAVLSAWLEHREHEGAGP